VWTKFLTLAGVTVVSDKKPLTNGVINGISHDEEPKSGPRRGQISEKNIGKLADSPLNGRVIKQIVRAAQALALSQDVPMGYEHLSTVLKLQQDFEQDFKSNQEIDYSSKDQRWSEVSGLESCAGADQFEQKNSLYR
jgi:hypothetical protein